MKTYTLKSVARRGSMLGAAFVVAAASFLPASFASADALNPLTERSLTLSSASPGWSYLDASGNGLFAPPNSGANGNQTGNTFTFKVSTGEEVKGFDFQYCTTPAGNCMGPGNIPITGDIATGGGARANNGTPVYGLKQSDLEIKVAGASEVSTYATKFDATTGNPAGYTPIETEQWDSNTAHPNLPNRDNSEGNFIVLHKTAAATTWTQSKGWVMGATEKQTKDGATGSVAYGTSTGKNNYITLARTPLAEDDVPMTLATGDMVKIVFFGTDTNHIINPGDKEFFVKINTYRTNDTEAFDPSEGSTVVIDGGVTVANVMNRSIEIQTKVLETMDFSVGTVDPNTLDSTDSDDDGPILSQFTTATTKGKHGICDPIVQGMNSATANNVLKLGDENGEFSLRTDTTYSTHSYWRLSSNSSGGATVYYSGVTLSNTVGDQIDAIGPNRDEPKPGSEQFGLALDHDTTTRDVSYIKERTERSGNQYGIFQNGEDNAVAGVHATLATDINGNLSYHTPNLAPLNAKADYALGKGNVNSSYGVVDTEFAFDPESSAIPTPFADGTEVLDCATGKMRYIANIAATTPAGIYTTKINYIASPKY